MKKKSVFEHWNSFKIKMANNFDLSFNLLKKFYKITLFIQTKFYKNCLKKLIILIVLVKVLR